MKLRKPYIVVAVLLVLLVGFTAGCSGSGQSGSGSKNSGASSGSGKQSNKQGEKTAKKNVPKAKTATGKVQNVKMGKNRDKLAVKPDKGKTAFFGFNKNTKVRLDGKKVDTSEIKKGQQVKVSYVVRKGKKHEYDHARLVEIQAGGGKTGGGETTG